MNHSRIEEMLSLPRPLDMDSRYNDMLDEIYSFDSVGGPFSALLPSRVLEACDPVAYRCGFSDWIDGEIGETVAELNGEYYGIDTLRDLVQERIDELEGDLSGVDDETPDDSISDDIDLLTEFLDSI